MIDCKPLSTPIEANTKICAQDGKDLEDATMYKQLVGSLIYLTLTRPDISYAVGIAGRFMEKPKKPHLELVRRILREKVLKGEIEMKYVGTEDQKQSRISQLPIPTLHHILCFLSQKEAVKTCLLSKQWRHIGSTRPNLEFSEELFNSTQRNFVSVVDRTLQGYTDQKLSINKLHLDFSKPISLPVVSLLRRWIPKIAALNIKVFKLNFLSPPTHPFLPYAPAYYDLPSAVFLAESLEELHLSKCRLSPVVESVRFESLRSITLEHVHVDGRTFETKMLGCPLLRRLVIKRCGGLRNIRVSEAASPGLKHFALCDFEMIKGRSIEIDVLNIETVSIGGPWIWSHRRRAFLFSRLTSLSLCNVILSSESLNLLSFGCPTLVSLALYYCSGFEEFHLASDSVKCLTISTSKILVKGVTICAPNIVRFDFTAPISQVPDTFSVATTTSKEWCSCVSLSSSCEDDPDFDANSWFLKLRRMLKALSGSQISLILEMDGGPLDVPCSAVDCSHLLGDHPPVVVEDLTFSTCKCRTASWYSGFMNALFRVCQPRHIWGCRNNRLSEFQIILLANKILGIEPYFWRQELEQVGYLKIVRVANGLVPSLCIRNFDLSIMAG
ncbi:Unknown protein [Striga hermonthica]|uniref:F-box domain-containing protein n=1 Tax=Striga hermonthica TaxID=68872 RepID=A0A9N7RL32_STRHE|nr:Unknown protein [Striga hermonthica]